MCQGIRQIHLKNNVIIPLKTNDITLLQKSETIGHLTVAQLYMGRGGRRFTALDANKLMCYKVAAVFPFLSPLLPFGNGGKVGPPEPGFVVTPHQYIMVGLDKNKRHK